MKSFSYAFEGVRMVFRTDPNMVIHAFATIAVIILSIVTGLTKTETIAIVFAIAIVWIAELFNTIIEKLADLVTVQQHPKIKFIKDVSAAAVLVAAIASAIIGCIIFIPKIMTWLS